MKALRFVFIVVSLTSLTRLASQNLYKPYQKAEEAFYGENFTEALSLYLEIAEVDPSYEDIQYKIEICKLLSDRQYTDMGRFFSMEETMVSRDKFYYYWRGRVQLEEYQFEEAIESLNTFLKRPEKKSDIIIQEARRWIDWAIAAKKFMDNPQYYEIHLLQDGINTTNAELSPVYFPEKEELLYLSNRNQEKPDEFQIYHTRHEGDRSWTDSKPIAGLEVFTRNNANIEVVAEDGRLFYFKKDKGGELFYSEPTESKDGWSKPKEYDAKVVSTHLSSHFFMSEKEDWIIFAKDVGNKKKPNLDLFESFKDPWTGKWSNPTVFDLSINSEFNEDSPYITPDGLTIYFASDGHETMGGYDIFKSELDLKTNRWKTPVNLGFPVNSPDDEMHFKLNPDQRSGYFSSNRLNTFGDYDIFFFWEVRTVKIKGRIIDGPTGEPITDARIFFRPYAYTDQYYFSGTSGNGEYETEIISDEVFKVELKMPDKSVIELEDFEVHANQGDTEIYKDFYIGDLPQEASPKAQVETPLATTPSYPQTSPANKIPSVNISSEVMSTQAQEVSIPELAYSGNNKVKAVLRNIYFAFDDTKVTDQSLPVLQDLLKLLTSQPSLSIEIAGHTDNVGDDETNLSVSRRRALAVKNWLVDQGIDPRRLTTFGYGETIPMATNDDEFEGRELNRRIEIFIRQQ